LGTRRIIYGWKKNTRSVPVSIRIELRCHLRIKNHPHIYSHQISNKYQAPNEYEVPIPKLPCYIVLDSHGVIPHWMSCVLSWAGLLGASTGVARHRFLLRVPVSDAAALLGLGMDLDLDLDQ
jgi:hypothetical protein